MRECVGVVLVARRQALPVLLDEDAQTVSRVIEADPVGLAEVVRDMLGDGDDEAHAIEARGDLVPSALDAIDERLRLERGALFDETTLAQRVDLAPCEP